MYSADDGRTGMVIPLTIAPDYPKKPPKPREKILMKGSY